MAIIQILNPNVAQSNNGVESNPPILTNANDIPNKGPTTPVTATGNMANTTIDVLNNNLAHACDFVLDLKKSLGLKKFIKAIAKAIREGIRYIMKLMGLSDASGSFSTIINKLKAIAEEIKYIQKTYIQPIIDFEKYVLAVIVKIRAIVQWILSLPARILALLKDCLTNLLKALASIFTDALNEAGNEVPLSQGQDFKDLIAAAKDTMNAGADLLKSTAIVVGGAAVIATSATAGMLIPVSQEELTAANQTIANYEKTTPTAAESTISTELPPKTGP